MYSYACIFSSLSILSEPVDILEVRALTLNTIEEDRTTAIVLISQRVVQPHFFVWNVNDFLKIHIETWAASVIENRYTRTSDMSELCSSIHQSLIKLSHKHSIMD